MADKAKVKDSAGNKAEEQGQDGEQQVQANVDAETDKGYGGVRTDPTPLEHYTVAGVTAGKPTPETDERSAERAVQAQQ